MKIVLMDTGRGNHREVVETWRAKLELEADDTVSLLSWQPPREPLPVLEHLVFGPVLQLRSAEPRRSRTAFDIPEIPADIESDDMPGVDAAGEVTGADPGEAEASLGEADLAGQLSEVEEEHVVGGDAPATPGAGSGDATSAEEASAPTSRAQETGYPSPAAQAAAGPDAVTMPIDPQAPAAAEVLTDPSTPAPSSVAHLKKTDPRRVRQAVAWRANKVRLQGRQAYRSTRRRLAQSEKLAGKTARRVLGVGNENIANSFAIALARSSEAAELFRSADVVVPMDARSQRGAWLLARRNEGPDVVVGFPAAVRAIRRRRGV